MNLYNGIDEPSDQEIYNLVYFIKDNEQPFVTLLRYDFSQYSLEFYLDNPGIILQILSFFPLSDIGSDIESNIANSLVAPVVTGNSSNSLISTKSFSGGVNLQLSFSFINLSDCVETVYVEGSECQGSGFPKHKYGEQCGMKGNMRATPGYSYMDFSGCRTGYQPVPGGSVGSPGGGGGGGGSSTPTVPSITPSFPIQRVEDLVYRNRIIQINIGQKSTNADWIKEMDKNLEFTAKLNELKSASSLGYESAYSMFNNAASGIQFSPKYTGKANDVTFGGQVALQTQLSSTLVSLNCIGFMHCHKNDGSTYKTFSFSDLEAFCRLASLSTQPQEQLSLYLTTQNGGTYVMKMTNKVKMKAFFNYVAPDYIFNTFDVALDKKIDKTDSKDKQTLEFLKFIDRELMLKDLGLEIYEKNNSGVWEKLTLSSNKKSIVKTNIDNLD